MRHTIHRPLTALGALALASFVTVTEAEAQQLRFSTTQPGGIAATGNTLGLSKALNKNGPGLEDSIGTFIAFDPNHVDNVPLNSQNPWPLGTTNDWGLNGSKGFLDLVQGAQVLYAELIWAGSHNYNENVGLYLDDSIGLHFGNSAISVSPSASTAQTLAEMSSTGFQANYYIRSADVTDFVKAHGAGSYTVSGVPGTQHESINALNAAGWTLVVAFRADDQPIRNLSIFVGGSFVDEDSVQDYTVDGFCAPPLGPVEGYVVVSALEGDADLAGDDLAIAASASSPFVYLSGPNNPEMNFFASQINAWDGMLDTDGSFGNVNHDAFLAKNVSGGRQGWDLTTVAISSEHGHLANNQKSAVLRTETVGDSYVPTMMALEIDVKAPKFSDSTTIANPSLVTLGDTITIDATLKNSGQAMADDMFFVLSLEPGLALTGYSTDGVSGDANGKAVTTSDLAIGVAAGDLQVGSQRTVKMTFDVVAPPANGSSFMFAPTWHHEFVTCDGQPPIMESHTPPTAVVQYDSGQGAGGGGVGGGDPGTGGFDGGPDDDGNAIEEQGNCGCATPGSPTHTGGLAFALSLLGLVGLRRRRAA
jgi:MYXO-CTERM domain-containing protein